MEQRQISPNRLFSDDADASSATTPEKCSYGFYSAAAPGACLDADDSHCHSAAKTARRPSSSHHHLHRIGELEASLQASQQLCCSLQQQLDECQCATARDPKALANDDIEECITYMLRCEQLEHRLQSLESDKRELEARLSESAIFYEMRTQQIKADSECEMKRATAAAELMKKELQQLLCAVQLSEKTCAEKDALLCDAVGQCQALEKQVGNSGLESELKWSAQVKAASQAAAAAEIRAAAATQAAEAKVIQAKISAAAEVQRWRREAEKVVTELGQAKATINDYMWRCEAMQCSLASAQQRVETASEESAATHRRALADLEDAGCRAKAAQAEFEAEVCGWRAEVGALQDALAESNARGDKFFEHCRTVQQQLHASQLQCIDLQQLIARIPRLFLPPPSPPALV
jgi:hypothetical protein